MNLDFTNDLLRLAYKEVSPLNSLPIIEDIENNEETKRSFDKISEMKKELDLLKCNPSDASIDFILNYSKRQKVAF